MRHAAKVALALVGFGLVHPTAHAAPHRPPARYVRPPPAPKAPPPPPAWTLPTANQKVRKDTTGRVIFALYSINRGERLDIVPLTDKGGFASRDLDRVAHFMRARDGNQHPVEPMMLDLIYRIQVHFQAPEVRMVSGYRTPRASNRSNHGRGRAMDFVLPGVANTNVAAYARSLGYVGVGIYPSSHFIHVDVRQRSYFWSDASLPGRRNRERAILPDLAIAMDKEAAARGQKPIGPYLVLGDVGSALKGRAHAPAGHHDHEEDEE